MEFMDIIHHTMACYTALPLIVMTFNDWARHTAKYRCKNCLAQLVLASNAYGYRCTECELPADPRGFLQTFGPYEVTE